MGVRRLAEEMGRECPWEARIRWWCGFEGSNLLSGKGVVVVLRSVEEVDDVEGRGISWKRCLSFVETMVRSSGKETERERREGRES